MYTSLSLIKKNLREGEREGEKEGNEGGREGERERGRGWGREGKGREESVRKQKGERERKILQYSKKMRRLLKFKVYSNLYSFPI